MSEVLKERLRSDRVKEDDKVEVQHKRYDIEKLILEAASVYILSSEGACVHVL